MSRKRTGLRNRNRQGLSAYATKHKGTRRDVYGQWDQGKKRVDEIVGGTTLTYKPNMSEVRHG